MTDSKSSNSNPADLPKVKRTGRKRRIAKHVGLGTLVLAGLIGVAAAILITVLVGKPIAAPVWLEERIETRVNAVLGGPRLTFDEAEIVVNKGWRPRARIRNVTLSTATGAEIVSFSELEASLAMRPLLSGQAVPKTIEMSGLFVTLRRDAEGKVTLYGGQGFITDDARAFSVPGLIAALDDALVTPQLEALTSADIYGVTLRYEDARADRAWTADGGRLRLAVTGGELTASADLALLSGGTGVATLEANYASRVGSSIADFGVTLADVAAADIAAQGPAFAWLDALRAPISGALRSGVQANGALAPISATLRIGQGVVQPNNETRPIPFQSARTYFNYDPSSRVLRFDELSVVSKWITARAEGQAIVGGLDGEGAQVDTLIGQFAASDLRFNPRDLYDAPVVLDGANLDFRLDLNPFRITLGQMLVSDQGQWLRAKGNFAAESDGWRFALDAQLDEMAPDRLLALWPEKLIVKTRDWVEQNLLAGELREVDVSLRGVPNERMESYLSFDFADADVQFMKTMPPIRSASGHASLLGNRFVASIDDGFVTAPEGGRVGMGGSSFIIPDVTVKDGAPAIARLETDSTVTAALSLLDQEPLRVMGKAGLPVGLADGRVALEGSIDLALKKKQEPGDVTFSVSGQLRDVRTDALVPNEVLSASALTLSASSDGVRVAGQGLLGAVPFDVTWDQPLGVEAKGGSQVRGTVEISQATLDEFNIALPPGSIRGKGVGEIVVDLPKGGGAPRMVLTSDLRGLSMRLAPLGWSKAAATPGTLRVAATLGTRPEVTSIALNAAGLQATGRVTLTAQGTLERASFSQVRVGGWMNAPVDIVGRGRNVAPEIRVLGGTIDLRTADFGSDRAGGSGQSAGPLVLALNELRITDTIALTGMQGRFTTTNGLDGSFTGRINGGAEVAGRVVPQKGRSAVRVTSQDAGGVVASAGIIQNARGGDLNLTLLPVGQNGAFDGELTIRNTRVKDAPAIADLLAAISIVGLLEQLSGDGIVFNNVEGSFRLTPNRMTLTKASATGPSLGISMDGIYNLNDKTLDMQGVVSPVYLLNGIGAIFTRKGEGLIGFNYALTGPAAKPRVSVNPLSALTPGLFREIFRRPPPELPEVEAAPGPSGGVTPEAFAPPETEVSPLERRRERLDSPNYGR
ncbi:YhdP family protein [Pseudosulfitobacter koreensis]|uniref:YhdP central domain-containing protein n=1 Tax=Pseudosulfitobacter koreensis TaxID=2968472 RepID=A0ABT1YXM7_9RHOB|nr:AsmA-like C-terminal region-containing protein [Pseudosulfitobacter koreense]MCR8825650.1 hypothetical protein [Pseudosulfitobacter koreense]